MGNIYLFVVDTNKYAGSFVRQLCGYVTGVYGDCKVGRKESEEYLKEQNKEESEFIELLVQKPDEYGCYRPCEIFSTPGYFNNGMGGEFKEWDEEKAKKHHRKECLKYFK